jgi:hypothetical protein
MNNIVFILCFLALIAVEILFFFAAKKEKIAAESRK